MFVVAALLAVRRWKADLIYAIFNRTGRKTKKLPRSKLFLSMVFQHGFLEGSTSEQMSSTVFPRG